MKFATKRVKISIAPWICCLTTLWKYTTHYYCMVNNVFHAIPNNQQSLLQFDIFNTQLVGTLLVMYSTKLRSGNMNYSVACSRNQTVSWTQCGRVLSCWKIKKTLIAIDKWETYLQACMQRIFWAVTDRKCEKLLTR